MTITERAAITNQLRAALTRVKFGTIAEYPGIAVEAFASGDLDHAGMFEAQTGRFLVKVRAMVTAETINDEEVCWPADWWQACRERWWPVWILRRWPVRYERRRLLAHRLYPRVTWPEQEGAIHGGVLRISSEEEE